MSSDPSPAGGEEEIRRLVGAYQQYQAQAEAIAQQVSLTQMTLHGLDSAIQAVEALDSAPEGQEMLVPIGSGSFVYAKLASKERVVLNVGAGVSIEKPAAEAKESLKARKAEVAEAGKKMGEMLNKIDQEMAKIQSVLSKYDMGTEQVV
ncbi:MAG: prefoldin subunit alpha [Methanotrichaceae archaeon]